MDNDVLLRGVQEGYSCHDSQDNNEFSNQTEHLHALQKPIDIK